MLATCSCEFFGEAEKAIAPRPSKRATLRCPECFGEATPVPEVEVREYEGAAQ